ncbi:unnamed protein product [Ilex paraguariensis]|uniref:Uncharacterized protein n=1 Tax=Ilex paraguariensis TaxID=185542 RepID=A0ABC8TSX2_9AQUA
MNEEDRRSFSSMLVGQEECEKNRDEENNRTEDVQNHREKSPHKGSGREATKNTASPLCQECNSISSPLMENNNLDNSCLSEPACSLPRSACSEPESAANIPSGADTKDNCTTLVHHLDSECSTTQADAS